MSYEQIDIDVVSTVEGSKYVQTNRVALDHFTTEQIAAELERRGLTVRLALDIKPVSPTVQPRCFFCDCPDLSAVCAP